MGQLESLPQAKYKEQPNSAVVNGAIASSTAKATPTPSTAARTPNSRLLAISEPETSTANQRPSLQNSQA